MCRSTWGESFFVLVQSGIVSILTLKYQSSLGLGFLYIAAIAAYTAALFYGSHNYSYSYYSYSYFLFLLLLMLRCITSHAAAVPFEYMALAQSLAIPLTNGSRILQIITIFKNKSTGTHTPASITPHTPPRTAGVHHHADDDAGRAGACVHNTAGGTATLCDG